LPYHCRINGQNAALAGLRAFVGIKE